MPFSTLMFRHIGLTILLWTTVQAAPAPKAEPNPELQKRSTQGGDFNLVNGTPYKWVRVNNNEYQIEGWNAGFERNSQIRPLGGTARFRLEFETATVDTWAWSSTVETDTSGRVKYQMEGCRGKDGNVCTFTLIAKGFGDERFEIYGKPDNFDATGAPSGTEIPLGWTHDHDSAWVLSGDTNFGFSASMPPIDWMNKNLRNLGSRPLKDVCMPGSHDAGMSVATAGTAGSFDDNTLTQYHRIGDQLKYGSRYFDIRPVISGGHMRCGHYSEVKIPALFTKVTTWQGKSGEYIRDVINQVNDFTDAYAELVILNFSHDLNTDIGNSNYPSFDQNQWNQLLNQITHPVTGLKRLHIADPKERATVDLSKKPLNSFIHGSKGSVLVIIDPSRGLTGVSQGQINISSYREKGIYGLPQYNVYDKYTGVRPAQDVIKDQLNKMSARPVDRPFLLSWTVTFNKDEDNVPVKNVLRDDADKMNDFIWSQLPPALTSKNWPSILYIDTVGGKGGRTRNNLAALALAVNYINKP